MNGPGFKLCGVCRTFRPPWYVMRQETEEGIMIMCIENEPCLARMHDKVKAGRWQPRRTNAELGYVRQGSSR